MASEAQAIFDGHVAYAMRQANGLQSVKQSFEELWLRKEPSRGQPAGPMDAQAQAAAAAIIADLAKSHPPNQESGYLDKAGMSGGQDIL